MFSDFRFISFWWLNIFLLSILSLPLTFLIFRKFVDRGYAFAKILSISLLTYFVFIAGVVHLLPFTVSSIFIAALVLVAVDVYILFVKNNLPEFRNFITSKFKLLLTEEIFFFVILALWSFVRGYAPNIEGLEKYMDWGFVNSALRSQYLPPVDMWFSGSPINYYYFGHLMFAFLTKLSGIDSAITYNLSIATVCALAFISAFSLSLNLAYVFLTSTKASEKITRSMISAAVISALLLTFGGNLHAVYKITKLDITQNNGHFVFSAPALQKAADAYWYPDATRFIGFDPDVKDKTIHEFPVYSFVVADLHGHMNDIPVVLFFMAMIFALTLDSCKSKKLINVPLVLLSGFTLSIAYMTNAWDFAIYGLAFAAFYFFYSLYHRNLVQAFSYVVSNGILIILIWYFTSLPFAINFEPMVQGLRLADTHTPFYQLFVLYGGFWLMALPFIILMVINILRNRQDIRDSDLFALALFVTGTILIILPEIGYVKDIYIYEHRRANTMFKLVYQAFMMYSILAGYAYFRFTQQKNRVLVGAFRFAFALIFIIHLIYPYFAIKSYYGLKQYHGLYGLDYLKNDYPDNYDAIQWINKNIQGQPVMLEAVGDSYTTYNQVSVATGLPTVEGWIVHEWLWRGGYDKPAARQTDVQKIYESKKLDEVRSLLQKYSVKYIFVGAKEKEKYTNLNSSNFDKLGTIVFESGDTKIYELK